MADEMEIIGICQACHTLLGSDQIEEYGASFCHVVAVPDCNGDPEPAPCGPVIKYAQAAKYRACVEALSTISLKLECIAAAIETHLPLNVVEEIDKVVAISDAALAGLEG